MNWYVVILIGTTVTIIALLLRQTVSKLRCPHCDSAKKTLIDKSVSATREKLVTSGEAVGARILENLFRKTYRCQKCDEIWYVEEPE